MRTWPRIQFLAALTIFGLSSALAYSGEISKDRGSISEALAAGFKPSSGSDVSPAFSESAKDLRVSVTQSAPYSYDNAKVRYGSIYLVKDSELLLCRFRIVESNPAAPAQDFAKPGSLCYIVK